MPVRLEFFEYSRVNGTGGELKTLTDQIGASTRHNAMENGTITVKPVNGKGHPTTIHIRNIVRIDGEKVYW